MARLLQFVVISAVAIIGAFALNNGLGRTPQMGWNSWNAYGIFVNESVIRETADRLVELGLDKQGYRYINVDDCWAYARSENGTILADPESFPSGMAALSAYVRSKNLQFGIYTDLGNMTCAGRPGSLFHEVIDAQTYASWGVNYVKIDNCYASSPPELRYPVMSKAMNATGHPMFFSACEWGVDNPATWMAPIANSWRTTGDIKDNWDSMMSNIHQNNAVAQYAGPSQWNDPDMLEVGNGGMTSDEYRVHFSLWCLVKAPLLIGCSLANVTTESDTYQILSNPMAISVNQDPLGIQGVLVHNTSTYEIWSSKVALSTGLFAAVLINIDDTNPHLVTATFQELGMSANQSVITDIWTQTQLGTFQNSYSRVLAPHSCAFILLTN